jgi:hypothetical protein
MSCFEELPCFCNFHFIAHCDTAVSSSAEPSDRITTSKRSTFAFSDQFDNSAKEILFRVFVSNVEECFRGRVVLQFMNGAVHIIKPTLLALRANEPSEENT